MTEILLVEQPDGSTGASARALASLGNGYVVTRIEGVRPALERLAQRRPHVLIATVGTEAAAAECAWLFERAVVAAPATVRLALLSAAGATGALPRDVAFAHQCLPMPVPSTGKDAVQTPTALATAVGAAAEVAQALRTTPALQHLLCGLEALPSPPALYFDIREQLEGHAGTTAGMSAIAGRDPALVARVLRLANSGFFGLPRNVPDIASAIALIGGDALLALVLSTHLYDGLPPPGVNLDLLWRHAVDVSASAREVARALGGTRAQQASAATSGLLHDIGLLVLLRNEPARYQPLWRRSAGDERALVQLERETFGVSHDELGAAVLTLWMLPRDVIAAVRQSHGVRVPPLDALVCRAVQAAEWLQHDDRGHDESLAPAGLVEIAAHVQGGWQAVRAAARGSAQPR